MRIRFLTLFPEFVGSYVSTSIVGRAVLAGSIAVDVVDIRDYATDRHRSVDDAPYGGGAGMVLMPGPLGDAIEAHRSPETFCVYPTPSGRPFDQAAADRLSSEKDVLLVCGRYEGIDQRIIDQYVDEELSIGDYVLSSGELAAMVIADAIVRLVDGVIARESLEEESFRDGLLEYPLYTRPEVCRGDAVPDVLLSGHHAEIARWRRKQQLEKTAKNRPDLLRHANLSEDERRLVGELIERSEDGRD